MTERNVQDLQEGGVLPSPADYIVEQYTSGNWLVRKWNSGIMEEMGYEKIALESTQSNGALYCSDNFRINFPVAFASLTSCVASSGPTSDWQMLMYIDHASNTSAGVFKLISTVSCTTTATKINVHAIGTWK